MEAKKFNEKESLELITAMIRNTHKNLDKGTGNIFIMVGVVTLITTILIWTLITLTNNHLWNLLWFIIPIVSISYNFKGNRAEIVKTYIDKSLAQLWTTVAIFCIAIPVLLITLLEFFSLGDQFILKGGYNYVMIPFIEMLIVSFGLALSGAIIDFKPLKIAGCIGMILSFGTLLNIDWAIEYTFAVWAIACLIIPGIKLNIHNKSQRKC